VLDVQVFQAAKIADGIRQHSQFVVIQTQALQPAQASNPPWDFLKVIHIQKKMLQLSKEPDRTW
jgi:hypothetical protein